MTDEINEHTIRDIEENWELESWNYNFPSTLENHDNIMGGMVCIWGENSAGVEDEAIRKQGVAMYNAMFPKLDVYRRVIEVPDENPETSDKLFRMISGLTLATAGLVLVARMRK
jgi:hypothetical protein